MSGPVPNTLMIERTESESKEEMYRFVDAMISIHEEIREIEEGKQPREGNVLKNSPHPQRDLIMGDGNSKWERPTRGRRLPTLCHTWKRRSSGPQLVVSTTVSFHLILYIPFTII